MKIASAARALNTGFIVIATFASVAPLCLHAQQQPRTQKSEQARAQEPGRTATATRVERAPRLDGTLDDPEWQSARPITNFLQREPFEGQAPTEKTEGRILYDKHDVYFGVLCFDSDPKGIITTELRCDVSQELDDYFEIIVDSAHDRRNAYVFQVNPLGTERDALITEEQRTESDTGDGDPGWDGVWISEARTTKQGWTATIAIPFSTLNFMQSRDVVWGLNFGGRPLVWLETRVWSCKNQPSRRFAGDLRYWQRKAIHRKAVWLDRI